jgi:hypothetical protein
LVNDSRTFKETNVYAFKLPSLGVRHPLTFHILIFSSETPQPNELAVSEEKI